MITDSKPDLTDLKIAVRNSIYFCLYLCVCSSFMPMVRPGVNELNCTQLEFVRPTIQYCNHGSLFIGIM